MKKTAVLTHDLRILCIQNSKLIACSLDNLPSLSDVVTLQQYSEGWNFVSSSPENWWYDIQAGRFDRYAPEGCIHIQGDSFDKGICRFKWADTYFHTKVSGHVEIFDDVENYRRECCFRLLDMEGVYALWRAMKERWILARRSQLVQVKSGVSTIWDIHFGRLIINFEDFIAGVKQREQLAQEELLLMADRNVYRALPYRPVVFYSLTAAHNLTEFSVSLQSLIERGEYKGEVCIATSLPFKNIEAFIPKSLRNRCDFVKMKYHNKYDIYVPMLALLASGVLDRFSPVCCFDSSVLVTKPIDPLLRRAVQGRGISAPVEKVFQKNEQLKIAPSSDFLHPKDIYYAGLKCILNTSILIFPSTKKQKSLLVESLRCMSVHLHKNKNILYKNYEKNIIHYVSFMMDMFDLTVLRKKDCNVSGQAVTGKEDGTLLCCGGWLENHRAELMRSYLESLPKGVS